MIRSMARLDHLPHFLVEKKLHLLVSMVALIGLCSANPPVIDFSHNMRVLKLPNNAKVGSIIYRIKGTDADNDIIEFGVRGIIGKRLLLFKNVSFYEADVYLKMQLEDPEYKITIYASDGKQFTEVESTIIVTQTDPHSTINDTPFLSSDNIIKLSESQKTNQTIATISVRKRHNSNLPVTFELRGSDKFAIKYIFGPGGTSNAEIYLLQSVDYEKQNLYILTVVALNCWTNETYDTRNIAIIDKVVVVTDIQDTPPVFTHLPNVVKISENTKVGSIVLKVSAEDGDYGDQRNITYNIDPKSSLKSYFAIDEIKGLVVLRRPVDDIKQDIGTKEPLILNVLATEVVNSEVDAIPAMSSNSDISLVIVSTDNKRPHFKSDHLIGKIEENSQHMTPVSWQGMSSPQVSDSDPGLNGTIILTINDPSDTFMIQPKRGINEIIFSIVVKDSTKLDYETHPNKQFSIKITATDLSPYIPLNSSILCTIQMVDLNDNIPQFTQKVYEALIPENAPPGYTVAKIEATDADFGDYGHIRYTYINGPLSDDLHIDPETGIVVLKINENINRELISEYRVTIEARDELGRGNKNVTELHIKIDDINDNEPTFLQPRYDAVLNPDRHSFTQPLFVKAVDGDEVGTPNSNVSYEIISGNYQDKFYINATTGEIRLNSPLIDDIHPKVSDPILMEYQSFKFMPVINLTIRAHDHGIPHLSSMVPVYIHNPDFLNRTVVFTIGDNEHNVNRRKLAIESGMASLSGAKVHIYSIGKNKQNSDMTEIMAWMAYPTQSQVDLDKTPTILSQITGKEFTSGETTNRFTTTQIAGNDFRVLFWLLIILIAGTLVFLIIFLLCWCCCCRDRYRKHKKLDESPKTTYFKTSTNDSVMRNNTSNNNSKYNKSNANKRDNHSVEAWNEDVRDGRTRNSFRPSSAPNNDQNHYIQNVRANSSQSYQDQYYTQNPSLYQRVYKMNRNQRARVGPQYYDSYPEMDYRNGFQTHRPPNSQMKTFKAGVDNMGYLRTTNDPYIIDDLNEHNPMVVNRRHPSVHHMSYNESLSTFPKRTEILYIQSPTVGGRGGGGGAQEDVLRSISQNELINEEQEFERYSDVSQNGGKESRVASKASKQRHIHFNDTDMSIIPEESVVVPGMVPKDTLHNQLISDPSVSFVEPTVISKSSQRVSVIDESVGNENDRQLTEQISVDKSIDNLNEIMNYSPYNEEDDRIQITSVKGVPVAIELKETKSATNIDKRKAKTKKVLIKENSFENSEKSYDSDSGIGKTVAKIDLDVKNSELMEKKSIFTIAYNDVKTRHLQSAESNAE